VGDIADMLIEQGIAQMTDQDYEPESNGFYRAYFKQDRTSRCKYCGTGNLKWHNDGGWRMLDDEGEPHSCQEYRDAKGIEEPDPNPFNDSEPDPGQDGEW
jgi:hypothetical protein